MLIIELIDQDSLVQFECEESKRLAGDQCDPGVGGVFCLGKWFRCQSFHFTLHVSHVTIVCWCYFPCFFSFKVFNQTSSKTWYFPSFSINYPFKGVVLGLVSAFKQVWMPVQILCHHTASPCETQTKHEYIWILLFSQGWCHQET